MKSSASINLYRRANGDVMGQIIDENGNKVTENFGRLKVGDIL
jgi:hypothetical protein